MPIGLAEITLRLSLPDEWKDKEADAALAELEDLRQVLLRRAQCWIAGMDACRGVKATLAPVEGTKEYDRDQFRKDVEELRRYNPVIGYPAEQCSPQPTGSALHLAELDRLAEEAWKALMSTGNHSCEENAENAYIAAEEFLAQKQDRHKEYHDAQKDQG